MEFGDGRGGGSPRDASDGISKQAKRKMKTPSQIDMLEKAYAVSSRLSEQMRQELAQKTELSSREISMWFANKRFQGKQVHLHRDSERENVNSLSLHSNPNGDGSGFVLAACNFMDSNTSEVSIAERSGKLTGPMPAAPYLKMETQVQQVLPKQQNSHLASKLSVLTFMEKKLGGRLREDGPLVGINFDPLPPGAFGAPLCNGNEMMRKLKQPTRAPNGKSIWKQNAGSTKASSIFQRKDSSRLENSLCIMPIDEVGPSVNPDSVHNLCSKLPCFPSEKLHPQTKEVHLQDDQFTVYPVNDVVDKFVLNDTLANDVISQVQNPRKGEEAQTAECKKQCIKRKREVQTQDEKEMQDCERHIGEGFIDGKQSEEGKLQYVDQLDYSKKRPNQGNMEEEKVKQPEEPRWGADAMEEAVNRSFITHGNIEGNVQLIEDEKLELMKLAASRNGLSSISFLGKDTLDKLHTFQDMLGTFPPETVAMKRPFAIPPWSDSEEDVGNLLMVWKFLVTFAGEIGLWPFTLEEFAQALHDQDSRLLGEVHVAVLKYIIRDLEDAENVRAYAACVSEDNGSTCLNIVDGAHAWGFDIHFWKSKLNFLTWPEILRQFGLSAGFGTKLKKKAGYAYHHGDKGVNAAFWAASLDEHLADSAEECGDSFDEHQLEDGIVLSTRNDEFLASGDVKHFSESWIKELTQGDYSSLSTKERLKVLAALVGVVVDGNIFHIFIEERLKAAQSCKKMMMAKMRLSRRLQEERFGLMDDLCSHGTINNISNQEKNLGQNFYYNSSFILPEEFEKTSALSLSQLELYIEQKAEMIHSYRFLPLGMDRRRNRYWQFSTSSSRNDPGSGRIFFESKDGFWRVIDSDEAFDALLAVLDTHGIRESHLYFMLKQIEIMFKDTTKRHTCREFYAESKTLQSSASLKIDLFNNEESISPSKKYLRFTKWMWRECLNPHLLCAMRYGTKRCLPLLETCHICYHSYLSDERHCASCHSTFGLCNGAYEDFAEHVARCEADSKLQISFFFFPINIQLMKAQLAIIEASIPMDAFHSFWDDEYRKSWGIKVKLSSSAREIFQSLTILEYAIKADCLRPDFVTTNELLNSEMDLANNTATVSEPVAVIPWIPETTAAVTLRLMDLDCSIPYMLQHGLEPLEDTEDGEFFVLPRSTKVELVPQVESAVSDDIDDQDGSQGCHTEDNCLHHEQINDGEDISISDFEDLSSSGKSIEVEINCESSDSLLEVEIPANMSSKLGVMVDEDESAHGDEFGDGEAVESNGYLRQETMDSYLDIEDYLDEQLSEGRHSNTVLQQMKDSRWGIVFSTKSADEENSSSVNTK